MNFEKSGPEQLPNREPVLVYKIVGEISQGKDMENLLKDIQEAIKENPPQRLIMDLAEVFYVNSSGIGMIMKIYKFLASKGIPLVMASFQREVAVVFINLNLFKVIKYFENVEEALKDLKGEIKLPSSTPAGSGTKPESESVGKPD